MSIRRWLTVKRISSNGRDILVMEVPLSEERRNPVPHTETPSPEYHAKKNTYISGSEISVGIPSVKVRQKVAGNPGVLLKGQCTDSLACRHLPWTPVEGQPLRKHQRYTGGN